MLEEGVTHVCRAASSIFTHRQAVPSYSGTLSACGMCLAQCLTGTGYWTKKFPSEKCLTLNWGRNWSLYKHLTSLGTGTKSETSRARLRNWWGPAEVNRSTEHSQSFGELLEKNRQNFLCNCKVSDLQFQ